MFVTQICVPTQERGNEEAQGRCKGNRSPVPHIRSFRSSKRTPVREKAETGEDEVLVDDYQVY